MIREPSAPAWGVCLGLLLTTPHCEEMDSMYDMYPDWGPAQHHPDNPRSTEAVQAALDLRDNGGPAPDDN